MKPVDFAWRAFATSSFLGIMATIVSAVLDKQDLFQTAISIGYFSVFLFTVAVVLTIWQK
jgi:hypothetical protein